MNPASGTLRLLIVDDDPLDREILRRLLKRSGRSYRVVEATNLAEARRELRGEPPHCVLLDYRLPDGLGLDLVNELREAGGEARPPVILLTGLCCDEVAKEAREAGAWVALEKGTLDVSSLERLLDAATFGEPPPEREL